MRKIVLLVALLAMVGIGAAEDVVKTTTDLLQYSFEKTATGPEAEDVNLAIRPTDDVTSSAQFYGGIPFSDGSREPGATYGVVGNKLNYVDIDGKRGCDDPYSTKLTQGGVVNLALTQQRDSNDKIPGYDVFAGYMEKFQTIDATGQMTYIKADFEDCGKFGIKNYDPLMLPPDCDPIGFEAKEWSEAEAKVDAPCHGWFETAALGTRSGTDMTVASITYPGAELADECGNRYDYTLKDVTVVQRPVISGFTSSYAGFNNGYTMSGDDIVTSSESSAGHSWEILWGNPR